mgnify:FL=1
MKLITYILYERLHRYIYDKFYIHDDYRHKDNKLTNLDFLLEKLYCKITPYLRGWRYSLKINLWFISRYERYEPRKLDLLNYEFENLNIFNKFIYSLRYQLQFNEEEYKRLKDTTI